MTDKGSLELVEKALDDECAICGKHLSQHNMNCGFGMCRIYPSFVSKRAMLERLSAKTSLVAPSRFHLTDEQPFAVSTAEGPKSLGKGWLIISEEEYAIAATPRPGRRDRVGPMAEAATCYIFGSTGCLNLDWPWDITWWKPTDYQRDLIKAAALLVAEIERIDRAALSSNLDPSGEE